jgi:hypothetical protein
MIVLSTAKQIRSQKMEEYICHIEEEEKMT